MIAVKAIIEKVVQVLGEKYPTFDIYLHNMPENISNPSFNIYLDADRSEDNNRLQTNETTSIGIYYCPPAQVEPLEDEMTHIGVYSTVKNVFRRGYFEVGGRALKVVLIRGGKQNNGIYIIVKLVYSDERPSNEEAYELMGEVKL